MALVTRHMASPAFSFEPQAGPSSLPYIPLPSPELYDETEASPVSPIAGPSTWRPREKRYKCEYAGCGKAYTKPSRLEEHEASHRGERTHVCPTCGMSYLRQDHLRAHIRTHLDPGDRPHPCTWPGCDKRFWTTQHLRRHAEMHDKAEVQSVRCDRCAATFAKAKQLRDHVAAEHMPEGTKPFICEHPGCGASFALRTKLKNHMHTHDINRYTCSDLSHSPSGVSFPTWSALQKHMHEAHPPLCPRPECRNRTFKSHARLKEHERVHRERDADLATDVGIGAGTEGGNGTDVEGGFGGTGVGVGVEREKRVRKRKRDLLEDAEAIAGGIKEEEGKSPKLPRVSGGEAGKVFACGREGCGKKFKTKYALTTHTRAVHLALRHPCPQQGCDQSFSHMCTLRRHLLSAHPDLGTETSRSDGIVYLEDNADAAIGGGAESSKSGGQKTIKRRLRCPAHLVLPSTSAFYTTTVAVPESIPSSAEPATGCPADAVPHPAAAGSHAESAPAAANEIGLDDGLRCPARFWRVYDMRWHLKRVHGVEVPEDELQALLESVGSGGDEEAAKGVEEQGEGEERLDRSAGMGDAVEEHSWRGTEENGHGADQGRVLDGGVQIKEESDYHL